MHVCMCTLKLIKWKWKNGVSDILNSQMSKYYFYCGMFYVWRISGQTRTAVLSIVHQILYNLSVYYKNKNKEK